MTKTFHLPSGDKIRPQSQRRYVLVREHSKGAFITYRSDVLDRVRQHGDSRDIIIDQATGLIRFVAHQGGDAARWMTQDEVKAMVTR
jgi:hypothetical protein